jgi:hypothetical protein
MEEENDATEFLSSFHLPLPLAYLSPTLCPSDQDGREPDENLVLTIWLLVALGRLRLSLDLLSEGPAVPLVKWRSSWLSKLHS